MSKNFDVALVRQRLSEGLIHPREYYEVLHLALGEIDRLNEVISAYELRIERYQYDLGQAEAHGYRRTRF